MGDYWWLALLGGVAMWTPLLIAIFRGPPPPDPDSCPECGHQDGLNKARTHCPAQDDHNGWSSDLCRCQNDYHWNYESTAIT